MPAPFPIANNLTGMSELFGYFNNVTNDWATYGFLLVIFFVIFVSIGVVDVKKGFVVASYATAIFAILLRQIGAIDEVGRFIFIIAAVVGTVVLLSDKF